MMTILEAPVSGGATVWPYSNIAVFSTKGSGVFWYNLYRNGAHDPMTMHAACPVLMGQKWIGNKWVGYNAQWNGENCGLVKDAMFRKIR